MHCAADVGRLPLGAGFQGRQVIFLFAELEASLIALMDLRMKTNFPHYFLFDFSCSFAKQFKVGKMTANSRGCCSQVVFPHELLMGSALFGTLSILPPHSVCCSRSL